MKLVMLVGLGPGYIVLDGDPVPLPPKGHSPPPILSPYLLSQNGWMDQDATWYGGRTRPRPHCIRWVPSSSLEKWGRDATWYGGRPRPRPHCARQRPNPQEKGAQLYPIFGPYLFSRNGWMDQDVTWYGGRPRPRPHCAGWDPAPWSPKGAHPQFSAHIYCGQTAGWIKMPLGTEVGLSPSHIVLHGDPAHLPPKGCSCPIFCRCLLAKWSLISAAAEHLLLKLLQ